MQHFLRAFRFLHAFLECPPLYFISPASTKLASSASMCKGSQRHAQHKQQHLCSMIRERQLNAHARGVTEKMVREICWILLNLVSCVVDWTLYRRPKALPALGSVKRRHTRCVCGADDEPITYRRNDVPDAPIQPPEGGTTIGRRKLNGVGQRERGE